MINDIWLKIAQFMGNLNGENVHRNSYVYPPEYETAEQEWKKNEFKWNDFLRTLTKEQQQTATEIKEGLEDFASAQEKRAYIQGYADCVQVLYHMGLLKENEQLKWIDKQDV